MKAVLLIIHAVLSNTRDSWFATAFVNQPSRSHHQAAVLNPCVNNFQPLDGGGKEGLVHEKIKIRSSKSLLRLSSDDDSSPSSSSSSPPSVLCVGETLWDSLPSGIYLGGAPSNVAVHLASLFQSMDSSSTSNSNNEQQQQPTVAIAACLGNDQLGREAQRRLSLKGVRTDYLQFHDEWETGMATAILDESGDATYEFNTPAAWDGLQLNDQLVEAIQSNNIDEDEVQFTRVFIMGTIAARLQNEHGATSFSTLSAIRNSAPEGTVVLDVNLRTPWYAPASVLELARGEEASSSESDGTAAKKLALLKLNEEELCILEGWCGLTTNIRDESSDSKEGDDGLTGSVLKERMEQLAISLNAQRVCVTRGQDGAALLCTQDDSSNLFYENSGYTLKTANNDSDTVGAGDSFLAALVSSLFVQNENPERALERACALGGYVAGCQGATPEHEDAPDDLRDIFSELIGILY